jgi:hypothetical protein
VAIHFEVNSQYLTYEFCSTNGKFQLVSDLLSGTKNTKWETSSCICRKYVTAGNMLLQEICYAGNLYPQCSNQWGTPVALQETTPPV